jgi:hypothetical protein
VVPLAWRLSQDAAMLRNFECSRTVHTLTARLEVTIVHHSLVGSYVLNILNL